MLAQLMLRKGRNFSYLFCEKVKIKGYVTVICW